jgi:hypothetical protein
MPDDDWDEPTDLSAIRRDHELIEAVSAGDLDEAHALAGPDDPLIALFDQVAECVANFRAAALDFDAELAEALRTLPDRRRATQRRRRLRALLVMAPLMAAVGVVVWRGLRR